MTEKVLTTNFKEVLERFLSIAGTDYKGHVHDNVLNIFNDLSEEERKLLLRGVVQIHDVVVGEVKVIPQRPTKPKVPSSARDMDGEDLDESEEEVVDYMNAKQKTYIKLWILKVTVITMLAFLFFVAIVAISTGSGFTLPFLESFSKVSGKIFGFGG